VYLFLQGFSAVAILQFIFHGVLKNSGTQNAVPCRLFLLDARVPMSGVDPAKS
jgi:hypothetical protein